MIQFKLSIQSFDSIFIKQTIAKIKEVLIFFEVHQVSMYSIPSKIKKYTVERSPHIDKKSREQFEVKRFKTNLEIEMKTSRKAQIFYYIIKNTIFPGVQITLSLNFPDYIRSNTIRSTR